MEGHEQTHRVALVAAHQPRRGCREQPEHFRRFAPQNDMRKYKIKNALHCRRAFWVTQVGINNYSKILLISCSSETCPDPTTEVVNVGLRLDLASMRILALSLNILGRILLRMKDMSMILYDPFGYWCFFIRLYKDQA